VGSISDHDVKIAERLGAQNARLLKELWEEIDPWRPPDYA
jgi:hypothetical protein